MKNKFTAKVGKGLDKRIKVLESRLLKEELEDRAGTMSELETLVRIREQLAGGTDKVSKDALLAAGVSIASILVILNYEKADIITSKAFSMLKR